MGLSTNSGPVAKANIVSFDSRGSVAAYTLMVNSPYATFTIASIITNLPVAQACLDAAGGDSRLIGECLRVEPGKSSANQIDCLEVEVKRVDP